LKWTKGTKLMSAIDKVHTINFFWVFPAELIWSYSSMQLLLTCFNPKLSTRKCITSFKTLCAQTLPSRSNLQHEDLMEYNLHWNRKGFGEGWTISMVFILTANTITIW
jgi:hypothetical protein